MIEYQNLKLESLNHYINSKYTTDLSNLLSKYYNKNYVTCFNLIKNNIKHSTNPIQFLKTITK